MLTIAHISDLHIRPTGFPPAFGSIDTTAMAANALRRIAMLAPAPDALVVTGDLADCGREIEYGLLREMLAPLAMPIHLVLGNHDRRDAFGRIFPERVTTLPGTACFVADHPPLRLIGLDTLVEGEGFGGLDEAQLDWLSATLAAAPDRPTALVLHHAPIPTGSAFLDAVRLTGGTDRLAAILAAHRQVRMLMCGHHHRAMEGMFAGVPVCVAPAVVNAVHLELGDRRSVRAIAEPPAFKLHLWTADGLTSHTVFVESFGGPFAAEPDVDYPALEAFRRETAANEAAR